jgi:putative ATP-grasp target RiPP
MLAHRVLAVSGELEGPLSSVQLQPSVHADPGAVLSAPSIRPLALRQLRPAPQPELPAYRYDRHAQVATHADGRPLGPSLGKEWTTLPTTHTDGDGGDNELWDWEEVQ